MKAKTYYIYILYCENNTLYTGYTTDLDKRFKSHLQGTDNCKYTRSFKPLAIAQSWQFKGERGLAMKIEKFIKKLSRLEKEILIKQPNLLQDYFSHSQRPRIVIPACF